MKKQICGTVLSALMGGEKVIRGSMWHTAKRALGMLEEKFAVAAYKQNRENGQDLDCPTFSFPNDGVVDWSRGTDGLHYARYIGGIEDMNWMEEKDRNYISRLARERHQRQLTAEEAADFEDGMQRSDIAARINKEEHEREGIYRNRLLEESSRNFFHGVQHLLRINAIELNNQDKEGKTALHHLIINGHTDLALQLLKKGIKINKKTKEGKTELHYAVLKGDCKLVDALEKKGVLIVPGSEETFIALARKANQLMMVDYFQQLMIQRASLSIQQKQKTFSAQLKTPVERQANKYAEKTIEQAIEARDWLLFKTLVKAKADLRCINCIPYLEELQAQDLTIEVLEECGAICDLPQLQTATKGILSRIETHPEEIKYIQRLYAAWQELIEGWQQGTLKNSTVAHQINANALNKLIAVWHDGQLPDALQEKVQAHLHTSSIKRHQQWLQNKLPEQIQQQLDQKISKVLWEQWKTQRHNDFPAQEQLAQNVLIVFKEHYKKQQLSKILTTAIDRKIIAEVIEQIKTNSLPSALAETLQPIADQLSQGKLITNMLPIYEQAMQQLINQWKSDELTEPTAAIIDGLATKVIAEIHPEPKLREQLDEEAVQLLLAQLKQNQLPEEVQSPLIQQTQDTISHLKPTEGQLNQALNKLLIEYKTNKSQFSQEEQAFLEDVILGEWKQLMEQLKMYAYPVTLVGEVKELRMENRELKQQLEIQQQTQESKIVQIQKQMESMMQQLQMSQQPEEPTTNMKFFNK